MGDSQRFTRSRSREIAEDNRILSEANERLALQNLALKNEIADLKGRLLGARIERKAMEDVSIEFKTSLLICQEALQSALNELKVKKEELRRAEAGQYGYTGPPGFGPRLSG
jgi:chromosome segregation ATPase